jgi:hypothetical protein
MPGVAQRAERSAEPERKGGEDADSAPVFEKKGLKRTVLRPWMAFFRSLLGEGIERRDRTFMTDKVTSRLNSARGVSWTGHLTTAGAAVSSAFVAIVRSEEVQFGGESL